MPRLISASSASDGMMILGLLDISRYLPLIGHAYADAFKGFAAPGKSIEAILTRVKVK
jgi:hypothetical protein